MVGPFRRPVLAAVVLTVLLGSGSAHGQTAWYEGFEGPQPSWRVAGGSARYRVVEHRRVAGQAHTGNGCEWLKIVGEGGSAAYVAHDVGRPQVIPDLLPTVWVRSDRSGLQLEARVVLPRTEDPRTGQPVSMLLSGTSYTNVGRWQQLRIDQMPLLLARQVRVLRTQMGAGVDDRGACVQEMLLNVYGGPGTTNVWIDDLDIAGYVTIAAVPAERRVPQVPSSPMVERPVLGPPRQRPVELAGSVLLVEGRPYFPRAIQYQGEPLGRLKQLGFNTVWLARLPTPEWLEEAKRGSLWVVCPPPRPAGFDSPEGPAAALTEIGPQFSCVLAWNLGWGLSQPELEPTRRWAEQVRAADRASGRPLICRPDSHWLPYSRYADLLLLDRRPLGTSLELRDYGVWLRQQPRFARPGTPIWTTVQTQLSPALGSQLAGLGSGRNPPRAVASEQLRLLVYSAVAAGSRGVLVLSDSPLTADDPQTRQRAMSLELLNAELEVMEPWAAGGAFAANAEATEPEVAATVLRTDRARLLMPTWSSLGAQWVPGQSAANSLALTVPGVPESTSVYELTPGGIQTLRQKRVTGGVRVTLDEFGLSGMVLLAQDPLIINNLARRTASIGPRAAELQRNLAVDKLHAVEGVAAELGSRTTAAAQSRQWLRAAGEHLQWCDNRLAAKEYPAAYLSAQRAMRALRLIERAYWEKAVEGLLSPLGSPGAASFATLPWHWRLADRVAAGRLGPNLLPGGDLEDLRVMVDLGWRHFQRPDPGVQALAELVPEAAHGGRTGLRLLARQQGPNAEAAFLEAPPAWITTAAVPVEAGQLLCIRAWVNIPTPIAGSVDGLLIADSLSGEDLAVRIGKTNGWQALTLYRVAPQSGPLSVSFVLTGLGEVHLDDVSIQVVQAAAAGQ